MKRRSVGLWFFIVGVALILSACVPSVHPFYFTKQVVRDGKLAGLWRSAETESTTWEFTKSGEQYDLVVTEEGKTGTFIATLFTLNKELYLDIAPKKCEFATNQADMVGASLIRGHLLLHIAGDGPKLRLAFTDFDWLDKELKANPKALGHLREEDGNLVLTASTRDLQKFVAKHMKELFNEHTEFVRAGEASR